MARFRAVGAIVIADRKYPAGQVFVDAPGAIGQAPNDVVWPGGLNKWNVGPNLIPLDAGAQGIFAASRFAGEVPWPTCGASSIS